MSSNTGLTSIGGVGVGIICGLGLGFICGLFYRSKICDKCTCITHTSESSITNIDFQYKYYELQNKYLNECEDLRIKNITLNEQVQLFKNRNRALCKLINRQRNKGLMLGCSSIGSVKGFVIRGGSESGSDFGSECGWGGGGERTMGMDTDADYAIVRLASAEC